MSKNEKQLKSFVKYCRENPELRFFQALRNWIQETRGDDWNWLLVRDFRGKIEDTFFW